MQDLLAQDFGIGSFLVSVCSLSIDQSRLSVLWLLAGNRLHVHNTLSLSNHLKHFITQAPFTVYKYTQIGGQDHYTRFHLLLRQTFTGKLTTWSAVGSNLRFGILPKDTLTRRLYGPGIKPL